MFIVHIFVHIVTRFGPKCTRVSPPSAFHNHRPTYRTATIRTAEERRHCFFLRLPTASRPTVDLSNLRKRDSCGVIDTLTARPLCARAQTAHHIVKLRDTNQTAQIADRRRTTAKSPHGSLIIQRRDKPAFRDTSPYRALAMYLLLLLVVVMLVVVLVLVLPPHLFWTPVYSLRCTWTYQPGSCRRKFDTRILSLLLCLALIN